MSSPFSSKLGTNYCPKDEEIADIKSLLISPSHRIQWLDEEITGLQRAIDKLKEERGTLESYIDAHKALISPVRRIPLDILQEIFVACIPTHRNCVMSATEAPLLLGRICSLWRTISLSTPRLWSALHIGVPYDPSDLFICEQKLLQRLETAQTWLHRSGECPLSLSVQRSLFDRSPLQDPLLHTLLPFACRWKRIDLTPASLTALSQISDDDVPRLKSIKIKRRDDYAGVPVEAHTLRLLRGPAICSLSLSQFPFDPLKLPLHWHNLVDLSISPVQSAGYSGVTSDVALQLLSQCPALQTCQLDIYESLDIGSVIAGPIIECAALHTLDIQFHGAIHSITGSFFSRLSFPILRELTLGGGGDGPPTTHGLCFVPRAPGIERLNISLTAVSRSFLPDGLVQMSPIVKKLRIQDYHHLPPYIDDEVLKTLIASHSQWFSSVQQLEIHQCWCSDEAVLHFIVSGMASGAFNALKRIIITFSRQMQVDILPRLHATETALHVELKYLPVTGAFSPWIGLADDPNAPYAFEHSN